MAGWTNKGKAACLDSYYRATGTPTNFYIALFTSASAPGADTNTISDLTQINPGNGYSDGGYQLTRNATDFDVLSEDDAGDQGAVYVKDVAWTATGGPIPASGSGARYACLTDDNATVANREIINYFDLSSDRSVSQGQTLTLQDLEIDLNES